jgi:hypothetical protein
MDFSLHCFFWGQLEWKEVSWFPATKRNSPSRNNNSHSNPISSQRSLARPSSSAGDDSGTHLLFIVSRCRCCRMVLGGSFSLGKNRLVWGPPLRRGRFWTRLFDKAGGRKYKRSDPHGPAESSTQQDCNVLSKPHISSHSSSGNGFTQNEILLLETTVILPSKESSQRSLACPFFIVSRGRCLMILYGPFSLGKNQDCLVWQQQLPLWGSFVSSPSSAFSSWSGRKATSRQQLLLLLFRPALGLLVYFLPSFLLSFHFLAVVSAGLLLLLLRGRTRRATTRCWSLWWPIPAVHLVVVVVVASFFSS